MVIAAGAAITKDKKILLIKRSSYTPAFPGKWAFPAGRADGDENPEECVIREVKEETGLDFKPIEMIKKSTWNERENYRFIGEWSGDLKIQEEEISAYGWFNYDEATKLELAFDYRETLDILKEKKLL